MGYKPTTPQLQNIDNVSETSFFESVDFPLLSMPLHQTTHTHRGKSVYVHECAMHKLRRHFRAGMQPFFEELLLQERTTDGSTVLLVRNGAGNRHNPLTKLCEHMFFFVFFKLNMASFYGLYSSFKHLYVVQ